MCSRCSLIVASLSAALALAAPAVAAAGPSIRCAGGLVSEGDARIDLLGKCGPPSFQDARVDERWIAASDRRHGPGILSASRTVGVVVELWSYDLGPDAFVHLVTLENGRVVAIERLGYGYRRPAAPPAPLARARCDLAVVHEGDVKLDVLSRCGEPAVVDAWDETGELVAGDPVVRGIHAVRGERSTVRVETWTYDLGKNRLVRFVRFENGRVVEVTSGGYGYAE